MLIHKDSRKLTSDELNDSRVNDYNVVHDCHKKFISLVKWGWWKKGVLSALKCEKYSLVRKEKASETNTDWRKRA